MEFILGIAGTVTINIVSNYLYEKLRSRKTVLKMTINRRLTEIDAGNITRRWMKKSSWSAAGDRVQNMMAKGSS